MADSFGFPGTPGIREVKPNSGSDSFGCTVEPGIDPSKPVELGIRKLSPRAEIDTSPPFGSVQEAVTWFGGRGSWIPGYKLGEAYNGIEEFDIKKVEEQAAELEKDLIVKELETLDVLEALGSTKRVVEDLKRQLQEEALKCMASRDLLHSDIKEMNQENIHNNFPDPTTAGNSSPYPDLSPDLILMELKQAKLNLGKIVNDLRVIESSVESLNTKLKKERTFLGQTCKRLTSEFAGAVSLAEELKQMRTKLQIPNDREIFNSRFSNSPRIVMENSHMYPAREQVKTVSEISYDERNKMCLRTAEMRLVAARKMEEAAKAAELLAIAEMRALSSGENENFSAFLFPENPRSPMTPKTQKIEDLSINLFEETYISRQSIMRKIEEATVEVKQSKLALEEALSRVDLAYQKQLDAQDAVRRWIPGKDKKSQAAKSSTKPKNQTGIPFFRHLNNLEPVDNVLKPVLKPTVSMRDVLSRKQVQQPQEDMISGRKSDGLNPLRKKANLSEMLNELKEEVKHPTRAEKDGSNDEKQQFIAQRRRFRFIHISLPLSNQSKKKT